MNPSHVLKRSILVVATLLAATTVQAQNACEEIKSDPYKAGGVSYMYRFDTPAPTPAPKGYQPFYISHYGRHGARYLLGSEYTLVAEVFEQARTDGKLTELGKDICDRYLAIYPYLMNRAGELAPKGQEQHKRLAKRMVAACPEIFGKHPHIEAYSTVVPRCIVSMMAFCEGLKEEDPSLEIRKEVSNAFMYYLNPHSAENPNMTEADLIYKTPQAPWRPEHRKFCEERIHVGEVSARLFTDTAYVRSTCDMLQFERDLFAVATNLPCTDCDESFIDLFTPEELCHFWECDNYMYYIEKGPDPRNRGRGTNMAESLLNDITACAEKDIAAGRPSVRLRFGHDGCIMALLCLMQIDGWTTPVTDPFQIKDVWQIYRIPMASNMQFIFYRNDKKPDDILLRVLLNEEEIRLPLPDDLAPYYHWNDFRPYACKLIKEARLKLEATK